MTPPFELCACGHANINHDINTLDDSRPLCCVEGCGCHSEDCPDCGGAGSFEVDEGFPDWNGHAPSVYRDCERCDGLGSVVVQ